MSLQKSRTPAQPEHGADLGARKAAILEAVVSQYIGSAQPVGSSAVADAAGLSVSSATIRAEMAALEHDGFLVQPHTSAGRIPTDKGYRYFVDHLTQPTSGKSPEMVRVKRFFDDVHGGLEEVLERSSRLLTEMTSYASVVVAPGHTSSEIRSAQVVDLGGGHALVLDVLTDGTVEKTSIAVGDDATSDAIAHASQLVNDALTGARLDAPIAVPTSADPAVAAVLNHAGEAIGALATGAASEQVFVGGPSRLAGAFDAVETVRSVLLILEQQLVVVSLLRDVLDAGLSVAIGHEHGYEPLASCAVIVAPVVIDDEAVGAVGLLGPTRMQYPAAIAAARAVGSELSGRLGGRGGEGGAA